MLHQISIAYIQQGIQFRRYGGKRKSMPLKERAEQRHTLPKKNSLSDKLSSREEKEMGRTEVPKVAVGTGNGKVTKAEKFSNREKGRGGSARPPPFQILRRRYSRSVVPKPASYPSNHQRKEGDIFLARSWQKSKNGYPMFVQLCATTTLTGTKIHKSCVIL